MQIMPEFLHPFTINSIQSSSLEYTMLFLLVSSHLQYILHKHYWIYVPRYICEAVIILCKSCTQLKAYCSKAPLAYSFSFTEMILKLKALWAIIFKLVFPSLA